MNDGAFASTQSSSTVGALTVLGDAFSIPVKCARHVVGIYNVPRQCGEGAVCERFRWTAAPPDGKAIAWQAGAPATARGEVATP